MKCYALSDIGENLYIENGDAIVLKEHLLLGQRKERKKSRAAFLSDK